MQTNQTAHTLGPWKVHHKKGYRYWIFGPNNEEIAILYSDDNTAKKNAPLIASAPELLSFIKDYIAAIPEDDNLGARAKALVAKAEGR